MKNSELSEKGQRAFRALVRFGMAEDEIDVLFKTEDELLAYYESSKATAKTDLSDEDPEPEPEDDYRLKPEEEQAILSLKKREDTEKARAKFDKETAPKIDPDTGAPVVPEEKPVDFDDFMKSLQEGMEGDDSNVPNN